MKIASTDAHGAYSHKDIALTNVRYGDVPQFYRKRFASVVHHRRHVCTHSIPSFPILTSPKACTFSQISLNIPSTSPDAARNECASIAKGAPITTSGAPYAGASMA